MKTKYPLVFVHGIAIKDIWFIKAFGRIDKHLTNEGYKIYKSKVDSFGTIENNAQILKDEINKILLEEHVDKVNIIAHSKGGLDAKYMIENLDMEDKVASLTTLCTPHAGSPIATNILRLPKWMLKFIAFWINFWYRIFGDKKPDSLTVCKQLAESEEIEKETFKLNKNVYCQSYASQMKRKRNDFTMSIPFIMFHYFAKGAITDGLVSVDSAAFGEYKGIAMEGNPISHSQIIGFAATKKKRERVYLFYSELCKDLVERGF